MAQQIHTEDFNFDFVIRADTMSMDGMVKSYGTFLKQLGQLNDEMMRFCTERLREDMDVPARIASTRAPADLADVYTGYCDKMLEDYSDQARRVMDLVGRMGWEPVVEAQKEAEASAAEAPAEPEEAEASAAEAPAEPEEAGTEASVEPTEPPASDALSETRNEAETAAATAEKPAKKFVKAK